MNVDVGLEISGCKMIPELRRSKLNTELTCENWCGYVRRLLSGHVSCVREILHRKINVM